MISSFFTLLLLLLGQPLDMLHSVFSDSMDTVLYQPSSLVVAPIGRNSLESFQFHGQVSDVKVEMGSPPGEMAAPRQLLQTMQFDLHGYLISMIRYSPFVEHGAARVITTDAITNQYDELGRLRQTKLSYTPQEGKVININVARIFNEQGHLSEVSTAMTDLSFQQAPTTFIKMPITYDVENRIVGQSLLMAMDNELRVLLNVRYQYNKDGVIIAETIQAPNQTVRRRQWFNAKGLLTEQHTYSKGEIVETKSVFKYNDHDDIVFIDNIPAGNCTSVACDGYVYDNHGNWTARALYSIKKQHSGEVRTPLGIQHRTLTYHEQDTLNLQKEASPMNNMTELTVAGIWSAPANNGVDLDGHRLLTRPEGIDEWPEKRRRQWLNDNGYDLSVDINKDGVFLHAVNTNLMVIANRKWDDADMSWIPDIMQPGAVSSPLVFWELPQDVDIPMTFAFRTANGASGMFRIIAYSKEKRTATLQIRLHE